MDGASVANGYVTIEVSGPWYGIYRDVTVQGGHQYRARIECKAGTFTGQPMMFAVVCNGVTLDYMYYWGSTTAELNFTVPSNMGVVRISLSAPSFIPPGAPQTCFADNYILEEIIPQPEVAPVANGGCITMTQSKWVETTQKVCYTITMWPWMEYASLGGGIEITNNLEVWMEDNTAIDFSFAVTPGVQQTLSVDIAYLEGQWPALELYDDNDGNLTNLTSAYITHTGINSLIFTPKSNKLKVRLKKLLVPSGYSYVFVHTVCVEQPALKQENVLVTICPDDKDRYRFGFNGQEKVNEWSGLGNFNEFKFRGYDSRIGRFISVDPLSSKYPWNSNYAFAENDVIRAIDLEGLEKLIVTGKTLPDLSVFRQMEINENLSEWDRGEYGYLDPVTGEMSYESEGRTAQDRRWHDELTEPSNLAKFKQSVRGEKPPRGVESKFNTARYKTTPPIRVPEDPGTMTVGMDIPFVEDSDKFVESERRNIESILRPLAMAMRTDPSITVVFSGNTGYEASRTDLVLTSETSGRVYGSSSDLMEMRAKKMEKTLVELGGDASRISTAPGVPSSTISATVSVTKSE